MNFNICKNCYLKSDSYLFGSSNNNHHYLIGIENTELYNNNKNYRCCFIIVKKNIFNIFSIVKFEELEKLQKKIKDNILLPDKCCPYYAEQFLLNNE